jgi:hypothetical protein
LRARPSNSCPVPTPREIASSLPLLAMTKLAP